jgi:hypothetical protein
MGGNVSIIGIRGWLYYMAKFKTPEYYHRPGDKNQLMCAGVTAKLVGPLILSTYSTFFFLGVPSQRRN